MTVEFQSIFGHPGRQETSREWHKSAPYLRLKITKGHQRNKKLKVSNSQKSFGALSTKPKRPN